MALINVVPNNRAITFDGSNADDLLAAAGEDVNGRWRVISSSPTELVMEYVNTNYGDTRTATFALGDALVLVPQPPGWIAVAMTAADFALAYREQLP